MAVPAGPPSDAGLTRQQKKRPPIPRRGLEEVLRSWSGQGQLWDALGAPGDLVADRDWTTGMVRRRAHRVQFERLLADLERWPEDRRSWLDALPASTETLDDRSPVPGPGVQWARTRLTGWPPRAFLGRRRRRIPETLLAGVTRWTLDQLTPVVLEGARDGYARHDRAHRGARTALSLLDAPPLRDTTPTRPSHPDLRAVAAEGYPWQALVPVARELLDLDRPDRLADLALEVVGPDQDLSGRLFHLAVLGEVLHAIRTCNGTVTSRHPLGDSSPGPAYRVIDGRDREWDLWFEAAGAWTHYGEDEPYPHAAAGVRGAGGALGTDLMLIRHNENALLLECKHSWNPAVVARDGYLQTLAYANEALLLAPSVTAAVVGPQTVVAHPGWANPDVFPGLVGIVSADDVVALVQTALEPLDEDA